MADGTELFKVDPAHSTFSKLLAEGLLRRLPSPERYDVIETNLREAATAHNDNACLQLIELLISVYCAEEHANAELTDKHFGKSMERAHSRFCAHLMLLYWQLPDKRKTGEHYSETERRYVPTFRPTLEETKLRMLDSVIRGWMPQLTDESRRVFRFIINCYQPAFYAARSSEEFKGKFISRELQSEIEKLVRGRTGAGSFSADQIAEWLMEQEMPAEIREVLVMSRAKRGGWELAKRDIRHVKLLENFSPAERSPEAQKLYAGLGEQAKHLDMRVQELIAAMKDGVGSQAYKIGASEYVLGDFELELARLDSMSITIRLSINKISAELAQDIVGRARRHVERWCQEHEAKWPGKPTVGNPIPQIRIWVGIYHGGQALDGIEGKT